MTTASETPPASERSKPPCWTTSNCPRPTIAIMAAKGRLPDKAPQVRLDGANKRHTRISANVEMTTVTKLLAGGTRNTGRSCAKTGDSGSRYSSTFSSWRLGEELGRTEHVEGIRE